MPDVQEMGVGRVNEEEWSFAQNTTSNVLAPKEKWYMEHMGVMAFWRTIMGLMNVFIGVMVALKVFGVV